MKVAINKVDVANDQITAMFDAEDVWETYVNKIDKIAGSHDQEH